MSKSRDLSNYTNPDSFPGDNLEDESVTSDKIDLPLLSEDITFSRGSNTRTVQSKLSDFVSVKDFGALGDGSDATDAIRSAMRASKFVYFPEGTYEFNGTINLPDVCNLVGASSVTTRINFPDTTQPCLRATRLGSIVRNLNIGGGSTGLVVGDENTSDAGRELLLEKVQFANSAGVGIDIQRGWSNYFNQVKVYFPGSSAVRLGRGFINSVKFVGMRTTGMGSPYTVLIDGSGYRSVEFNHSIFEGNLNPDSIAFYASPTSSQLIGLALTECYFETHNKASVDFSNSNCFGVTISGCDFNAQGGATGIIGANGLSIIGCTFVGNPAGGGAFIEDPSNSIIINCGARNPAGSWDAQALIGGTISNCFISNLRDSRPEQIQSVLPDSILIPRNAYPVTTTKSSSTIGAGLTDNVIRSPSPGSYLVVGKQSTGTGFFLADSNSATVTLISSTGTFGGTLAWSGSSLRGTSPGSSSVSWYVMKFDG